MNNNRRLGKKHLKDKDPLRKVALEWNEERRKKEKGAEEKEERKA